MNNYRIFSRKAYKREGGKYVPYFGARKITVGYAETIEQARAMCASGPANAARKQGREYRNLPFHEFEAV